ncbi:DUF58 domain-containing protein [Halobellus sp. EA9]|uniref:DUF58 domain-containing protein n=1 Tax=Halobellus sp. EA9 TaxID=3421647 RepID=UPI003EBD2AC5
MSDRMQITDRFVILGGVCAVLVAWGVILSAPVVFVGAAMIGAWLLAAQYRFVTNVRATTAALTVTQTLDRTRVTAEETTLVQVEVATTTPAPVSITVSPDPPISGEASPSPCNITIGEAAARESFDITWPVAGQFELNSATITFTDRFDLFRHTVKRGTTPTVTVEPRAPQAIHIGEGGERIASGFGEHDTGRTGSGLKPAELRQYTPGDAAQQIDWKATARLAEPYVREFEAQTDLETVLLVDHSHTMDDGPQGATKLAFARQVALGIVASAQHLGDPLGCYTVGNAGLTNTTTPSTTPDQYQTVIQQLQALTPTRPDESTLDGDVTPPARAREAAARLPTDTVFGDQLRPFFEATDAYIQRVADRPLFHAARLATARNTGATRTIIITDDENRAALREAVKVAQRGDGQVLVYLTPTTLFSDGTLRNLDATYRRYTQFEEFRRSLTSLPRVKAFEVGPNDRLARILTAGRTLRDRRAES